MSTVWCGCSQKRRPDKGGLDFQGISSDRTGIAGDSVLSRIRHCAIWGWWIVKSTDLAPMHSSILGWTLLDKAQLIARSKGEGHGLGARAWARAARFRGTGRPHTSS